jgi:hypothetical protein
MPRLPPRRASEPAAPTAASAAPSATPQQPVARNAASERIVKRGVSSRSREAGKNRAGMPSDAASAWIAGSSTLRSIETMGNRGGRKPGFGQRVLR